MSDIGTVPCELCGEHTPHTSMRRCSRCFELEERIWDNPEIARRILAELPMHSPVKLRVVK